MIQEFVIEDPARLIGFQCLMPVGGFIKRVPADKHGARVLGFVKPQQEIGEAQDRSGSLVAKAW